MSETGAALDIRKIADEAVSVIGQGRQIATFSSRDPGFSLEDAYRVTPIVRRLREARGEKAVGRKIGFTNRNIWQQYGVYAPIWGYVYDSTVRDLDKVAGPVSLIEFAEPRIEPEIVFGLSAAPDAGMSERELLSCIGWVAHGYEIVQSIFPGWKFSPSDTVAAFGLHGALFIGGRHPVSGDLDQWMHALSTFEAKLVCGDTVEHGRARDVLDGPLSALRHLVGLLANDSANAPLAAGEIITTGTITRAMPVKSGERWTSTLSGIPLGDIGLEFI